MDMLCFTLASAKLLVESLRGYTDFAAQQFGQTANMRFVPFEEFCASLPEDLTEGTRSHLLHSPH
jgi:hypothetical protein